MEGRVEYRDLVDTFTEDLRCSPDPAQIRRIVQRGQLDAVFDLRDHIGVDLDRFSELFPTMNDAVADGMDVTDRSDRFDPGFGRDDPAQDQVESLSVIPQRHIFLNRGLSFRLQGDESM